MKENKLKYAIIGLVNGAALSDLTFLLGYFYACYQEISQRSDLYEHYWTWDIYFNCVILTSLGCFVVCLIYGVLSNTYFDKSNFSIKNNVIMLTLVFLFTKAWIWFVNN